MIPLKWERKKDADKETLERYRIDKFDQHFEIDTTCLLSRNNTFTIVGSILKSKSTSKSRKIDGTNRARNLG